MELDAIIVTRGGGSIEDLWAFNERVVADAILGCSVPVVAAIGHEVDTSIAELVADRRCATPTQAAAVLVPDAAAERHHLSQLTHRLGGALRRRSEASRAALAAAARHPVFTQPDRALVLARQRLAERALRLARAGRGRVLRCGEQLAALGRHLQSVGPTRVLQRGYSYTLGPAGKLVRTTGDVAAGDELTTHLSDGAIRSVVADGQRGGVRSGREGPRSRKRKTGMTGQGGLFEGPD
jgi:exodeoxyribonuclease VII large subunit